MAFIVLLTSVVGAFFIVDNLGALMLFGKYYKMIEATIPEIVGRVLLGVIAFILSYGIYLVKSNSIEAIAEIKRF